MPEFEKPNRTSLLVISGMIAGFSALLGLGVWHLAGAIAAGAALSALAGPIGLVVFAAVLLAASIAGAVYMGHRYYHDDGGPSPAPYVRPSAESRDTLTSDHTVTHTPSKLTGEAQPSEHTHSPSSISPPKQK